VDAGLRRHEGALAWLIAVLLVLAVVPGARAQTFVSPGEMKSGSLLFAVDTEGRYIEAPRLGTDVNVTVSGPVARTILTQRFANPAKGWVEGIYVFPLPEGAAVDTLKMVVGDRVIIGTIKERQEAKQIFEQAKAAGQKAGLLEQERPNIFTTSLANIGPGESVVIQIEYQESVRQSGEEFSLRVPLVVAPRYMPKPLLQTVDLGADGNGWGQASDPVPDRARIEPPVLDPRVHAPVNPVTISVRLAAGFPLADVKSHHHEVRIGTAEGDARIVSLAEGAVPADRDFELTWRAGRGADRRPVPRTSGRRRLSPRLPHAAGRARHEQAASPRDRVRDRQLRLHGRHLHHPGEGESAPGAPAPEARRPIQCRALRRYLRRPLP
jgi:Ca-activated chloride channel family protein